MCARCRLFRRRRRPRRRRREFAEDTFEEAKLLWAKYITTLCVREVGGREGHEMMPRQVAMDISAITRLMSFKDIFYDEIASDKKNLLYMYLCIHMYS